MTKNRYILAIVIYVAILPQITFAAWWNPTTWRIWSVFRHTGQQEVQQMVPDPTPKLIASTTSEQTIDKDDELRKLREEVEQLKAQQKEEKPKVIERVIEKPVIIEHPVIKAETQSSSVTSTSEICNKIKAELNDFNSKFTMNDARFIVLVTTLSNYLKAPNSISSSGNVSQSSNRAETTQVYNTFLSRKDSFIRIVNDLKTEIGAINYVYADIIGISEIKNAFLKLANDMEQAFNLQLQGYQLWMQADSSNWREGYGYNHSVADINAGTELLTQGGHLVIDTVTNLQPVLPVKIKMVQSNFQKVLVDNKCN